VVLERVGGDPDAAFPAELRRAEIVGTRSGPEFPCRCREGRLAHVADGDTAGQEVLAAGPAPDLRGRGVDPVHAAVGGPHLPGGADPREDLLAGLLGDDRLPVPPGDDLPVVGAQPCDGGVGERLPNGLAGHYRVAADGLAVLAEEELAGLGVAGPDTEVAGQSTCTPFGGDHLVVPAGEERLGGPPDRVGLVGDLLVGSLTGLGPGEPVAEAADGGGEPAGGLVGEFIPQAAFEASDLAGAENSFDAGDVVLH